MGGGGRREHLVIFAKAPQMGRTKTRLAHDIGALSAMVWYRRQTHNIIRRLQGYRRWQLHLFVTPAWAAKPGCFWPDGPLRHAQQHGDLGRRMAQPARVLPPGPVVIIGSDIPGITRQHIADAFALLRQKDVVFGPACDGGYWLYGMARRRYHPALSSVRWSTPHALSDSIVSLPPHLTVGFAATLRDVDNIDDLVSIAGSTNRLRLVRD